MLEIKGTKHKYKGPKVVITQNFDSSSNSENSFDKLLFDKSLILKKNNILLKKNIRASYNLCSSIECESFNQSPSFSKKIIKTTSTPMRPTLFNSIVSPISCSLQSIDENLNLQYSSDFLKVSPRKTLIEKKNSLIGDHKLNIYPKVNILHNLESTSEDSYINSFKNNKVLQQIRFTEDNTLKNTITKNPDNVKPTKQRKVSTRKRSKITSEKNTNLILNRKNNKLSAKLSKRKSQEDNTYTKQSKNIPLVRKNSNEEATNSFLFKTLDLSMNKSINAKKSIRNEVHNYKSGVEGSREYSFFRNDTIEVTNNNKENFAEYTRHIINPKETTPHKFLLRESQIVKLGTQAKSDYRQNQNNKSVTNLETAQNSNIRNITTRKHKNKVKFKCSSEISNKTNNKSCDKTLTFDSSIPKKRTKRLINENKNVVMLTDALLNKKQHNESTEQFNQKLVSNNQDNYKINTISNISDNYSKNINNITTRKRKNKSITATSKKSSTTNDNKSIGKANNTMTNSIIIINDSLNKAVNIPPSPTKLKPRKTVRIIVNSPKEVENSFKKSIILQSGKWRKSLSLWRRQQEADISFKLKSNRKKSGIYNRMSVAISQNPKETLHDISKRLQESLSTSIVLEQTDEAYDLSGLSLRDESTASGKRLSSQRSVICTHFNEDPEFNNQKSIHRRRRTSVIQTARFTFPECIKIDIIPQLNSKDIVLRRCRQSEPLDFNETFSKSLLENCRKIGEGVYGEVFMKKNISGEAVVLKIIPIEGNIEINGEPQKKFDEILAEIVIAMELSNLKNGKDFMTKGFVDVVGVKCVQGRYPEHLVDLWELYRDNRGTDNDHPEIFTDDQLYIVLELANGGQDLEAFNFNNALQSYSAFIQTALSLAVAENKFEFEHRDLHWGNILLKPTDEKEILFKLNGEDIKIPSHGVKVSIIDYTLSRMVFDGCVFYNDLSTDDELFSAGGDYQFDIYRLMKSRLENCWQRYEPYTNILWLHYTIDKMINGARYRCPKNKKHRSAIQDMMQLRDELLDYKSSSEYVKLLN